MKRIFAFTSCTAISSNLPSTAPCISERTRPERFATKSTFDPSFSEEPPPPHEQRSLINIMSGQPPDSSGEGNKITNDGVGDDIRKAGLAVRVEDAVKALNQLAIEVIRHYKKEGNGVWKNVAHELDNCNSDLRLWQYDVSMPITVPAKTKEAEDCQGSMDLSAYDVLEILEAQSDRDPVCERISGELHKLEQGLVGCRHCFAESSSILDPDKDGRLVF